MHKNIVNIFIKIVLKMGDFLDLSGFLWYNGDSKKYETEREIYAGKYDPR